MQRAIEAFDREFGRWQLAIPAADIEARRAGHLKYAGWSVLYEFGNDQDGEYLDYYASRRDSGDGELVADQHVRLRDSGGRELLPPVLEAYLYSRDPTAEELTRAREQFQEKRSQAPRPATEQERGSTPRAAAPESSSTPRPATGPEARSASLPAAESESSGSSTTLPAWETLVARHVSGARGPSIFEEGPLALEPTGEQATVSQQVTSAPPPKGASAPPPQAAIAPPPTGASAPAPRAGSAPTPPSWPAMESAAEDDFTPAAGQSASHGTTRPTLPPLPDNEPIVSGDSPLVARSYGRNRNVLAFGVGLAGAMLLLLMAILGRSISHHRAAKAVSPDVAAEAPVRMSPLGTTSGGPGTPAAAADSAARANTPASTPTPPPQTPGMIVSGAPRTIPLPPRIETPPPDAGQAEIVHYDHGMTPIIPSDSVVPTHRARTTHRKFHVP